MRRLGVVGKSDLAGDGVHLRLVSATPNHC